MAAAEHGRSYQEPMQLDAFLNERAMEEPLSVAHAPLYLLTAIEAYGTREVVEEGEKKQRYRFFDDPENDGEHAILGNTDMLNELVEDLRSIAAKRGKDDKILWAEGPTASGKSELKRCFMNMLEAYSKRKGPRYTVQMNINDAGTSARGFDGGPHPDDQQNESDWYQSPVQMNPLQLLPPETREQYMDELNEASDHPIDIQVEGEMDPFIAEAWDDLDTRYRIDEGVEPEAVWDKIASDDHLQITNYPVIEGQGIGVLYSDNQGTPNKKLVGAWINELIGDPTLDSRGGRDARAFGYDGIVSQGNSGITVLEDASEHPELLMSLLNVPEESSVRLDQGITMDVDTLFLMISNPDLEEDVLDKFESKKEKDKFRKMKRRLDRRKFKYLTNYGMETELLRREVANELETWEIDNYEKAEEKIRAPLNLTVRTQDDQLTDKEIAPHGFEAAAMYDIVSRFAEGIELSDDSSLYDADTGEVKNEDIDGKDDFTLIDKAILYERGELVRGDDHLTKDDFEIEKSEEDGREGIMVTVTRDAIAELINQEMDHSDAQSSYEHVIMPEDITDEIVDNVKEASVFSAEEKKEYPELQEVVNEYVFQQQEDDVLAAMLRDMDVPDSELEQYIDHVEAYVMEEDVETDDGPQEPSESTMREFEVKKLGRFNEDNHYDGFIGDEEVEEFRSKLKNQLNDAATEKRGDIDLDDIKELPLIEDYLEANSWRDVVRHYDNFDPVNWDTPPSGTDLDNIEGKSLQELKDMTIRNMVDMFDYSESSARVTADRVVSRAFLNDGPMRRPDVEELRGGGS